MVSISLYYLIDSPLFVSCDEVGVIKTWDVRYQTCVQSILTTSGLQVRKFLNLNSNYFVGMDKRLVWFKFEEVLSVNSQGIKLRDNNPIGIEFNTGKYTILMQ